MVAGLSTARIVRVSGPLLEVEGLPKVAMADLVALGEAELPGEVVAISAGTATVQAYEYTGGLRTGDPARALGRPLSVRLGPELLGGVHDGLLRPLAQAPPWLPPGSTLEVAGGTWEWRPAVREGDVVEAGAVLGTVPTAAALEFRVLVPPGLHGAVTWLAPTGPRVSTDPVALIGETRVAMATDWPVRRARPTAARLTSGQPLLTGQRVLDAVFPVARGSTAAVPGGFGTGKTLLLQQVAKWCTADVIVYVGCGERGNEMADVLAEFGDLVDPRTGRRLVERTVIIANTSNMPMMAREASIYTGVTVAEFFRDMGHNAVVIADSTSRWAEAMREWASRSGTLPAEEGYPASLPSALAAFYERAGSFTTLGGGTGSVTIIGAVSPPGGDTTEPVTTHTERFVRAVWDLDRDLAYARHYPAVAWSGSFSLDADGVAHWYAAQDDPGWAARRAQVTAVLAEADRLADLAALVGRSSLPSRERVVLWGGRLLREGFLQQSALSANDSHCSPEKTRALLEAVLGVIEACHAAVQRGVTAAEVEELDYSPLLRAGGDLGPDDVAGVEARRDLVLTALEELR